MPPSVRYCIDCKTPSKFADKAQVGPEVKHVYQVYNVNSSAQNPVNVTMAFSDIQQRSQYDGNWTSADHLAVVYQRPYASLKSA